MNLKGLQMLKNIKDYFNKIKNSFDYYKAVVKENRAILKEGTCLSDPWTHKYYSTPKGKEYKDSQV